MKIETIKFQITGISPLLMHNPSGMKRSDGTSINKKKIPTAEDEAEAGVYRDAKGIVFPVIGFRSALLYAVSGKKVGKRSARNVIAASVFNCDEFTAIIDPSSGKPVKEYVIDSRRAVVQGNGIIRSRPRFNAWALVLRLDIDTDLIAVQVVLENLNEAGLLAGVGDFRVEKRGWFGRFKAKII